MNPVAGQPALIAHHPIARAPAFAPNQSKSAKTKWRRAKPRRAAAPAGRAADDDVAPEQLARARPGFSERTRGSITLIFQCRLFSMTPCLAERAARRRPHPHVIISVRRERPSSIVRPKNEIAEAPPSRREWVGLIAGRSADHLNVGRAAADRRRWVGAPLAHEDSARVRSTGLDNADLSMPPVFHDPVAEARGAAGGHTHLQRSSRTPELQPRPRTELSENGIGDGGQVAAPAGRAVDLVRASQWIKRRNAPGNNPNDG